MSPVVPSEFRSPLTSTAHIPTLIVSAYSPDHGLGSDNLALTARAAVPTPADLLNREAGPQYYITLTVTSLVDAYTTTILLGDNYPASSQTDPVQQSASTTTLAPAAVQNSSLSPGSVAAIIIGVLGGIAVLAWVIYVYMLRIRQWQRENGKSVKKRKKKKKKSNWFILNFKFKKSKKRRRSRRSSTSTGGKSRRETRPKMRC
jgi:hypothetical protein